MGWSVLPCVVHCFLFPLLLLHFTSFTCSSTLPLCNLYDSSALLQFKNSIVVNTSIPNDWLWLDCPPLHSKLESWENGTNCCQWDGVTCDAMSGHVIGLDLSCSHLQGKLHPNSTLFHLAQLQRLNLALNDFSGSSLHPAIGDLVSLTHLNLSSSSFGGDVPSTISHLSKLVSLDLSDNMELMRLDASTWNKLILNATNLEELVLNGVNMSSIKEASLSLLLNLSSSLVSLNLAETRLQGNFPMDVLCLPNIEQLSLSWNQELTVKLPKSNWSVPLRLLDLSGTALSGEKPDSIGHLKSLQVLSLGSCQLEGLVPASLWNLTQLTFLDLSSNHLSGEIPSLLSNLNHLIHLSLGVNSFSGHFPDVFGYFTQLQVFDLSENNLEGQLPLSLFNLTQLTYLFLSYNNLEGPIPNITTKFSKLAELDLRVNLLNGSIPHWLYSLRSLTWLFLDDNKLTGSIGEFSTSSLMELSLSNNKFEGNFPNSVFELENLTSLSLSSNNLGGSVNFHQFSKLKYLESLDLSNNNALSFNSHDSAANYTLRNLGTLYLSSCNITEFPKFITRLPNLEALDLSNNNIYGKIPKWFNDNLLLLSSLNSIDLSFNKLQGDLPILPFGNASSLMLLDLSHNFLTGDISSVLCNASSLSLLDLSHNFLIGDISSVLCNASSLWFLDLSHNLLTGDISSVLCNASSLEVLNLSHNNLTSMIPQCMGAFPNLKVLDLQMNKLYGSIPQNFSKSNSFQTIKLNENLLEGPLPRSLTHCTYLEVLDLGGNYIQDMFPNWLDTLPSLQVLILRANKFHGKITSFNTKHPFRKLRIFDVSNNTFSGPLPATYLKNFQAMMNINYSQSGLNYMGGIKFSRSLSYNESVVIIMKGLSMELERILTTFSTIDLSNNKFEGEIPRVIGELNSLKGLNLSHNEITGTIPQSLGKLTNLEWLDLSWNHLRGEIPMSLTDLNFLSVLNLSQNQLEGPIPTGKQFNTLNNDSYEGNPMLCGVPLSKSCGHDEEEPPSTTLDHGENFEFGWEPVAVGYACGVVFGMLLGYCFFMSGKPLWLARLVGMPKTSVRRTNNRGNANRRRVN